MAEITLNEQTKETAVLAGILTGRYGNEYTTEATLEELAELARTAGADVKGIITQARPVPENSTYFGEGKLEELTEFCQNNEIDLIIFDDELSGNQQKNIEDITGVRVVDRSALILDIFAARATSREGKLQVELAQLKYNLPRLYGKGHYLSRLGGGIGTRGPGETQLETDKRHIRRRISALEEELKEVAKHRQITRNRRTKDGFQTAVLVGYTNAGKSTLMNLLTNAGVLSEDKLFATLDPTARGLELPDGRTILLLDTVGFIRKLPHHFIEAFKSTLEEAVSADLILLVSDISSPEYKAQLEICQNLLTELGCGGKPIIYVNNKCDLLDYYPPSADGTVNLSAKDNRGVDLLLAQISEKMPKTSRRLHLLIPYNDSGLTASIREDGKVFQEEFQENGIFVDALIEEKYLHKYQNYEVIP